MQGEQSPDPKGKESTRMNDMQERYQLDTSENREFLEEIRENLLDFGRRFPSEGGSSWYLGGDGRPLKERDRETYITGRMAHAYSLGSFLNYPGSAELVDAAVKGLSGELRDKKYGGWYAGLHADNRPLPDKLCYAHAFVMLGASSALLAGCSGAGALLMDAEELFDLRFWDEKTGLTRDTWNTEFTVLDSYRGLNANMHTVEAFLAVADATGEDTYRKRAGRIIDHVLAWASGNEWRIPEHYTEEWTPDLNCNREKPDDAFKPYGATPGHGIEWSRLITQWALSSCAPGTYITAAENLYQRAVSDGWYADGAPGIVYTTDWEGKPVVHDRMHWTIAEAINTSAVLYRVTKKEEYSKDYAQFMQYLDKFVLDHVNGSWFHQLDRRNRKKETVWPGKPDIYHALQSTLIPYCDPSVSIATAIKEQL